MKQLTILLFLLLSTTAFASEQTTESEKKKDWKKIQDVIKSTIEKAKRSQSIKFQAPVFQIRKSIELNSFKVTNAQF